jgi:hypothetical protein
MKLESLCSGAGSCEQPSVISMTRIMRGFPAAPEDQVTLENWRTWPFNQWAFQHVREIIPSADVANDPGNIRVLPLEPIAMDRLRINGGPEGALSFDQFLSHTNTDGIVILRRGCIVFERYSHGLDVKTPHILM